MERIDPFSFYLFGKHIRALLEFSGDVPTNKAFWPLITAKAALNGLLEGKPIPIGISAAKARACRDRLVSVENERFTTKNEKGEPVFRFPDEADLPISAWEWDWVKTTITEFETVFAEEMKETATYFVPRRGIYYTPALVDTAEQTFPADLMPFIPQKAKDDWKAAGRCLAFNLLSASGFHTARAVEGCLESYYQLFSGKAGKTLRNWNDYIDALRKIAEKNPTPRPTEKTLTELDQMRTDYRNPIMHPRVVLTEGDARMVFANGESLIIAMAQEIGEAQKTGVQLALITETQTEALPAPKGKKAAEHG